MRNVGLSIADLTARIRSCVNLQLHIFVVSWEEVREANSVNKAGNSREASVRAMKGRIF